LTKNYTGERLNKRFWFSKNLTLFVSFLQYIFDKWILWCKLQTSNKQVGSSWANFIKILDNVKVCPISLQPAFADQFNSNRCNYDTRSGNTIMIGRFVFFTEINSKLSSAKSIFNSSSKSKKKEFGKRVKYGRILVYNKHMEYFSACVVPSIANFGGYTPSEVKLVFKDVVPVVGQETDNSTDESSIIPSLSFEHILMRKCLTQMMEKVRLLKEIRSLVDAEGEFEYSTLSYSDYYELQGTKKGGILESAKNSLYFVPLTLEHETINKLSSCLSSISDGTTGDTVKVLINVLNLVGNIYEFKRGFMSKEIFSMNVVTFMTNVIGDLAALIKSYVVKMVEEFLTLTTLGSISLQGLETSETGVRLRHIIKGMVCIPLILKFKSFLPTKIEEAITGFETYCYQDKFSKNIFGEIFSFLMYIGERSYHFFTSGDYSALLGSDNPYYTWWTEVTDFIENRKFHSYNDTFEDDSYLHELISRGEEFLRLSEEKGDLARFEVTKLLRELKREKTMMFTEDISTTMKERPLMILLYGPPNIGKSMITALTHNPCVAAMGLPSGTKYIYTDQDDNEYDSGLGNHQHTCFIDDLAASSTNVKTSYNPITKTIKYDNEIQYATPQAELERKGKIFARFKIIISTTNTKHLNSSYYATTPAAVLRRWKWVVSVYVKDHKRDDPAINALKDASVSKVDINDDAWWFVIERAVMNGKFVKYVRYNPKGYNNRHLLSEQIIAESGGDDLLDRYQYLEYIYGIATTHSKNSGKMHKLLNEVYTSTLCTNCYKFHEGPCLKEQGLLKKAMWAYLVWYWILYFVPSSYDVMSKWRFSTKPHYFEPQHVDDRFRRFITTSEVKNAIKFGSIIILTGLVGHTIYNKLSATDLENDFWTKKNKEKIETNDTQRGTTLSQLAKKVKGNMFKLLYKPDKEMDVHILGICADYYITNCHTLKHFPKLCVVTRCKTKVLADGLMVHDEEMDFNYDSSLVAFDETRDIAVFRLLGPHNKNLLRYFLDTSISEGRLFDAYHISAKDMISTGSRTVDDMSLHLNGTKLTGLLEYKLETKDGDCGKVNIIKLPNGSAIHGIHCAGGKSFLNDSTYSGIGTSVSHGALAEALLELEVKYQKIGFKETIMIQRDLTNDITEFKLQGLSPNSDFVHMYKNNIPFRNIEVIGTSTRFKNRTTTSGFYERPCIQVVQDWIPLKLEAPIFNSRKIDGQYLCNYRTNTLAISNAVHTFPYEEGWEHFLELKTNLVGMNKRNLKPFSLKDAINGIEGVRFVDHINFDKGAGPPYQCVKEAFFDIIDENHRVFKPEIHLEYERILRMFQEGRLSCFVSEIFLKDEPVKSKKNKNASIRSFNCHNFLVNIIGKQYFGPVVAFLQNQFIRSESAIGVVHCSYEWGDLYHHLNYFKNCVAGDYKKFDKTLSPEYIRVAINGLIDIAKSKGYNQDEINVMCAMREILAYPFQMMKTDIFASVGGNTSGNWITGTINSIVNCLYMRTVFKRLYPEKKFSNYVRMITYGDDNVMTVSDSCPLFNQDRIAKELQSFGVTYTLDTKDENSDTVLYRKLSEITFLKRKFVKDSDLGVVLSPLALESIAKGLCYGIRSNRETEREQNISAFMSARDEFVFHGRDVFNEYLPMIEQCADVLGVPEMVCSFDVVWSRYMTKYSRPVWG